MTKPALARGVRLAYDDVRGVPALLYPEGVLLLNESAGSVLELCDGSRMPAAITAELSEYFDGVTQDDVDAVITEMTGRHLVVFDAVASPDPLPDEVMEPPVLRDPVPVGMVAELSYKCPLHCPYCSNPVNTGAYGNELTTGEWLDAFEQARRLGVLQVHLSGGEPMLRKDIAELVAQANRLGMYTNLITSGIPMDAARLDGLVEAGLDHVQLSIQDSIAGSADTIAGMPAHERKLLVAGLVKERGLPLTINVVLHRQNVGRLLDIAELAAGLGADRLELAHTQYYGWGLLNRDALLPTLEQVEIAERDAAVARELYGAKIQMVYVIADHHRARPKACMAGWGSRQFVIAPNGDVLPCLAAGQIPDLGIVNLRTEKLAAIWYDSAAFNKFRGTDWMQEPCRSCPLRHEDLGGCRCQAFQLTGDAAATDPVCELSPKHDLVTALLGVDASNTAYEMRRFG